MKVKVELYVNMSTPDSDSEKDADRIPTEENVRRVKTVLPHHMAGGPMGLGLFDVNCKRILQF